MKNILENYLYLLTEDPEMDVLESKHKELKSKIIKMGPDADRLGAKYANVDRNNIPYADKKILDDYRDMVEKYKDAGEAKSDYAKWVTGGKQGPKPGTSGFRRPGPTYEEPPGGRTRTNSWDEFFRSSRNEDWWKDFERDNNNFWEDFERNSAARAERYAKFKRTSGRVGAILWTIYIGLIITAAYSSYKQAHEEEMKRSKKNTKSGIIAQILATKKQIDTLKKGLTGCSKTNDPKKCREQLIIRIKAAELKLSKLEFKLKHK